MVKKLFFKYFFILFFIEVSYGKNYIDMCFDYIKSEDYQKAVEIGRKAVKIYPNNSYAYLCLGWGYTEALLLDLGPDFIFKQNDLAIENLKKAEVYANSNDYEALMRIYGLLGENYYGRRDLDNAFHYFIKTLDLAKRTGNKYFEALSYKYLGEYYKGIWDKDRNSGDKDLARGYYKKAYEIYKSIDEEESADIELILDKLQKPDLIKDNILFTAGFIVLIVIVLRVLKFINNKFYRIS